MFRTKQSIVCLTLALFLSATCLLSTATAAKKSSKTSSGGREPIKTLTGDPYLGAIVIDVATGKILFEDNADKIGYPASMVKLMDLLIIIERIEKGQLKLDEQVTVTAEASLIGGSGVYLKEHEVFTVDEMLYALIIQSANDSATALALHIAGSKEGFVKLMNARAAELGMKSTKFSSVHGLPPGKGQQPDITTARDMAILSCELVKHPDIFRYTSAKKRVLRANTDKPFIMETHNHLLTTLPLPGCDGLKTGYYQAAGSSIAATAIRNDRRVIAVVLGSSSAKIRDPKAREIINSAFLNLPPLIPLQPVVTNTVQAATNQPVAVDPSVKQEKRGKTTRLVIYLGLAVAAIAVTVRLFKLASITHH